MENLKILLAGADTTFVEQVRTFLRNTGIELLSCRRQEETLEVMQQARPEIVYLSAKIPGGGLECLRAIRENERLKRIPVVMVCTNESEDFLETCRTAGCECLIRKPLDRQAFLASVIGFIQLEKRTNARFGIRINVNFGVDSPEAFRAHSVNLSIGGMFIETGHVFPVGTTLQVRFKLPSRGEAIQCATNVAWINRRDTPAKPSLPMGMGLEFDGLSLEGISRINQFVHEEYISKLLKCSSSRVPSPS